jgi:hypothetical protein
LWKSRREQPALIGNKIREVDDAQANETGECGGRIPGVVLTAKRKSSYVR